MTLPVLPQDVFDEIFSQLTDRAFVETVRSCSLVCRSFRRNAQKILFRSIVVVLLHDNCGRPINLVLIVEQAPHLIEYIQDLKIDGNLVDDPFRVNDSATSLANALDIFSPKAESFPINLRSLWLEGLSWRGIPHRLQDTLVLLMTVHSLRDITLHHIIDCPANLVQNLPLFVKHLSMSYTTFLSLPATRNELPKLESLKLVRLQHLMEGVRLDQFLSDGMPHIVDMTQLKTFNADVYKNSMPLIGQILQPTSKSLKHLTLRFDRTDLNPVPIDLTQFSHLTDITIEILCYVPRILSLIPSAVILIARTMRKISHRNVIQNISLCLFLGPDVGMAYVESATKDMWQELDTICSIPQLTLSNSFRGITFTIESTALNCDAFSDLVQNKLPETKKASKLHILKDITY